MLREMLNMLDDALGVGHYTRLYGFVLTWSLAASELGRAPTMDEWGEYMGYSRAQAFRIQHEWRVWRERIYDEIEGVPYFKTPGDHLAFLVERIEAGELVA